jgi:hypothetical protein
MVELYLHSPICPRGIVVLVAFMTLRSVTVQAAATRWFLIPKTQVQSQAIHMGFVVDELALRQVVFGVYFSFPLPIPGWCKVPIYGHDAKGIDIDLSQVVVSTADYGKAMNFQLRYWLINIKDNG